MNSSNQFLPGGSRKLFGGASRRTGAWAAVFLVAACGGGEPGAPIPKPYSVSAYEVSREFQQPSLPWEREDLRREILSRLDREMARREMDVRYYRIGYTLTFPLPPNRRPVLQELPVSIPKMNYPWLIWLAWDLEERWRVLHQAWRMFDDRAAGKLLQQELAALSGWDQFTEMNGSVGLVTAHLAASLALALDNSDGWDADALRQARVAAEHLIERDVWPWFNKQWAERELTPAQLGNIPAIALVRAAQLARVIGSPRREALEARSRQVLRAWYRCRMGDPHHTEGTAYDGYLLDSITEWMAGLPDCAGLVAEGRDAFRSQTEQWLHLTLPGRADLHAPLGDVEAEMTFWATALVRLTEWYQWPDAAWLLRRVPLERLRAAALVAAYNRSSFLALKPVVPEPGVKLHPNAWSFRSGWESGDVLAVVGLSQGKMGHLHFDGGQFILGWHGRFWITDPGYQQYRPGEERDYTLGILAHNPPAIRGQAQTQRAAKLVPAGTAAGWQHARVNLSACYGGLAGDASVQRDVWLSADGDPLALICDRFGALGTNADVRTTWQLGEHLGLAFLEGWVRLSNGRQAVWVGTFPGRLNASQLERHPGSRGSLALTHGDVLMEGNGSRWWVFWCDSSGGWKAPEIRLDGPGITVRSAAGEGHLRFAE